LISEYFTLLLATPRGSAGPLLLLVLQLVEEVALELLNGLLIVIVVLLQVKLSFRKEVVLRCHVFRIMLPPLWILLVLPIDVPHGCGEHLHLHFLFLPLALFRVWFDEDDILALVGDQDLFHEEYFLTSKAIDSLDLPLRCLVGIR